MHGPDIEYALHAKNFISKTSSQQLHSKRVLLDSLADLLLRLPLRAGRAGLLAALRRRRLLLHARGAGLVDARRRFRCPTSRSHALRCLRFLAHVDLVRLVAAAHPRFFMLPRLLRGALSLE